MELGAAVCHGCLPTCAPALPHQADTDDGVSLHMSSAQDRCTLQSGAEKCFGVLKLKCSLKSFSFVPKGPYRGGGHEPQPCHHHEIVSSCAMQHSNNCEIPREVTDLLYCNISGSKQGRRGEATGQGELPPFLLPLLPWCTHFKNTYYHRGPLWINGLVAGLFSRGWGGSRSLGVQRWGRLELFSR